MAADMGTEATQVISDVLVIPDVLLFRQDVIESGTVVGSIPVAWGIRICGGQVATWPLNGIISFTIHDDIDSAAFTLKAWPSAVDARHVERRGGRYVLLQPEPVGESTAPAPAPVAGRGEVGT